MRVVKSEGFPEIVFAFHHSCCYFFPNREEGRRYREAVSQDGRTLLTFFSPSFPLGSLLPGKAEMNDHASSVLLNLKPSSSSSLLCQWMQTKLASFLSET